jgi:hypothetical protein
LEKMIKYVISRIENRGHAMGIKRALEQEFPLELSVMLDKHAGKKFSEALWIEIGNPSNNLCGQCGKPTLFINFAMGYREYCSRACAMSNPDRIAKSLATNRANHGGIHASQTPEYRKKFEKTMIERHGAAYTLSSNTLKERAKNTVKKRYGVDSIGSLVTPDSLLRAKETRKNTMQERYGVNSALQVPEFFEKGEKTRRTAKEFTLNGKTFVVRGFEDTAIRHLIDHFGISVTDIFTTSKDGNETVWYEFEGKRRRYHPDMTILYQGRRIVVEVKSTYTLGASTKNLDKNTLDKNLAKWTETAKNHEVLLIVIGQKSTKKKEADPNKVALIENPHLFLREEFLQKTQGFK